MLYTIKKELNKKENTYFPKVDIIENTNKLNFVFEIPGFEKNNISLKVKENMLEISGMKSKGSINKNFERVFQIPENYDLDSIDAKLENGLLLISILKAEKQNKTFNISIN